MSGSKMHGKQAQKEAELRQANSPKGPLATKEHEQSIDLIVVTAPIAHKKDATTPKGAFEYITSKVQEENLRIPYVNRRHRYLKDGSNGSAWDRLTAMFKAAGTSPRMVEALQNSSIRIVSNLRISGTVVYIVHYRLPSTVRDLPTAGVLLNSILTLTQSTEETLTSVLMKNGISYLACSGESTESVNTIESALYEVLTSAFENLAPQSEQGVDFKKGPILANSTWDVYGQADISEMVIQDTDGGLLIAANNQNKQEESAVTELDNEMPDIELDNEMPVGADFFAYEASSLTLEQKCEALNAIGYDTTSLTESVIDAAFDSESEIYSESQLEEEDPLSLEADFGSEFEDEDLHLEDEEEDEDLHLEDEEEDEDLQLEDEEEDEDLQLEGLEEDEDEDEDLQLEDEEDEESSNQEYMEALSKALHEGITEDNVFELATAFGLVEEDSDPIYVTELVEEVTQHVKEVLQEEQAQMDENEDFEYLEEGEDEQYPQPAEDTSRYLHPAGSNVLGDMYTLDVNQVLIVNFTLTNTEAYSDIDLKDLTDIDGVNYLFPFQVGHKRSTGSMMLPAVRTIDLMDSRNPGQVLVSDPNAFDPDEFAERLENLIMRGLPEALYEDRVPTGIDFGSYELPVGEFADDDGTESDIAFIEGYDEDLVDFESMINDMPTLPISQLYSGISTVRKMEIDGHCAFTNGVVLNFAVPGLWLESFPEDQIQEMVQGAINAARTRVAGNASCPTYCSFTYDSALLQSNDRLYALVSALRDIEEEGMSFNSEDVRLVEESSDAFGAIAAMEDRDLPLTVLMSGAAGFLYDHGGNTTVMVHLNEEETEEEDE